MFTTHKSRRALSRIHAAIQNVAGHAWADGGDNGGGGGGGNPDPKPAPEKPKPGDGDKGNDAADKVTLTKAEREKLIADAKAEAKREAEEEQRKREQKAAKDKAKEEGDKDALLKAAEDEKTTEKARADAAEAKAKALELRDALRTYIDADKPELAKAAPLIAKLIDQAAADDDADKAIKAAVAEYEKSLPEKAKGSAAAPAGPARTANRAAVANQPKTNGHRREHSVASARF